MEGKVVYRIYFVDEFIGGIHADTYKLIDEGDLVHKQYNIKIFDSNGIRVANFYSRNQIDVEFNYADENKEYYNVYID